MARPQGAPERCRADGLKRIGTLPAAIGRVLLISTPTSRIAGRLWRAVLFQSASATPMTATIERFLDEVRANPRSSLEMVDLIEEILTRRYLAGDDDNADAQANGDRIFEIISQEHLTLKERCEALAALFLEA